LTSKPDLTDVSEFVGAGLDFAFKPQPDDVIEDLSDKRTFTYSQRCNLAPAQMRRDMAPAGQVLPNKASLAPGRDGIEMYDALPRYLAEESRNLICFRRSELVKPGPGFFKITWDPEADIPDMRRLKYAVRLAALRLPTPTNSEENQQSQGPTKPPPADLSTLSIERPKRPIRFRRRPSIRMAGCMPPSIPYRSSMRSPLTGRSAAQICLSSP
jgi:hypothetical protein